MASTRRFQSIIGARASGVERDSSPRFWRGESRSGDRKLDPGRRGIGRAPGARGRSPEPRGTDGRPHGSTEHGENRRDPPAGARAGGLGSAHDHRGATDRAHQRRDHAHPLRAHHARDQRDAAVRADGRRVAGPLREVQGRRLLLRGAGGGAGALQRLRAVARRGRGVPYPPQLDPHPGAARAATRRASSAACAPRCARTPT